MIDDQTGIEIEDLKDEVARLKAELDKARENFDDLRHEAENKVSDITAERDEAQRYQAVCRVQFEKASAAADRIDKERRKEVAELKTLLRYVFYGRLPGGDKIEEYIPREWAEQVTEALK